MNREIVHQEPNPYAGKTVKLKSTVKHFQYPNIGGAEFWVEDWQDRVFGQSWMTAAGNPACLVYAMRSAECGLPLDNDVVYGKYGSMGCIIHMSEIDTDEANKTEN